MSEDIAIARMTARLSQVQSKCLLDSRDDTYLPSGSDTNDWFGFSLCMVVTSNFVGLCFFDFLLGILSQWLNIISTMSVAIFIVIVIGSIIYFNFMLTLLVLCIITCTFYANDEENGIVFIPNEDENSI